MWMLAIPTAPGRCRCLWWFFHPSENAPERLRKLAAQPIWKDHMTRNTVFDGDNVFLHGAVSSRRFCDTSSLPCLKHPRALSVSALGFEVSIDLQHAQHHSGL